MSSPPSPAAVAMTTPQRLALAAVLLTGILLLQPFWVADSQFRAGAAVLLAIGLWTTGWLPPWLTALVFFTLCMAGKLAPATEVFAGFASSAVWLVFSGAVLGEAIRHTGLGDRLARRLAPALTRSYGRAVAGVTLFSAAMLFIMPSAMGRVMLLLPILASLADRLGYRAGSQGRHGLILGGLLGTYLPATAVLPANIPNNVLAGAMESILGTVPAYGPYFLLHFPILGALRLGLLILLLAVLYRDTPRPAATAEAAPLRPAPDPATPSQRRLGLVLAVAVILWSSDGWHHIPAAWTGMLAALACLFPGSGLLPANAFGKLRFEAIFYVAGIVSLGAVADSSGLGGSVARLALEVLPLSPEAPGLAFGLLAGLSTLVGLAVTLPGVPPVMTPLVPDLAAAVGWSPLAVAMTQVVAFSSVILPYQAPPLVVAIQAGYVPGREVTRLCLLTAGITIVALWPLDYWWWRVLGVIG